MEFDLSQMLIANFSTSQCRGAWFAHFYLVPKLTFSFSQMVSLASKITISFCFQEFACKLPRSWDHLPAPNGNIASFPALGTVTQRQLLWDAGQHRGENSFLSWALNLGSSSLPSLSGTASNTISCSVSPSAEWDYWHPQHWVFNKWWCLFLTPSLINPTHFLI